MLEENELDVLVKLSAKHPELEKLLSLYHEYLEDPEIKFYRSITKMITKLSGDMDAMSETPENLLSTDKTDDAFNRIQKLIKDAGKTITDLKEAKTLIFKAEEIEKKSEGGLTL